MISQLQHCIYIFKHLEMRLANMLMITRYDVYHVHILYLVYLHASIC